MNALKNGEHVTVTERGKERGVIVPVSERAEKPVETDAFFGMHANDSNTVEQSMNELRKDRYAL